MKDGLGEGDFELGLKVESYNNWEQKERNKRKQE